MHRAVVAGIPGLKIETCGTRHLLGDWVKFAKQTGPLLDEERAGLYYLVELCLGGG
jgi:hypothetical protein